MKKYDFRTAEKIMWIGAVSLFVLSMIVGWTFGFVAELPIVFIMLFWGVFVRRFMTK
jgi:hypothetical protein